MSDQPVRDASTVVLIRDWTTAPAVLMGQRGATAAFMPRKFVFPGGALDAEDCDVAVEPGLSALCAARLAEDSVPERSVGLAAAAIRELWEETGLILGQSGTWHDPPEGWASFAATGHRPVAAPLSFIFRAITPPGRPRRFDARFFLATADAIAGDIDDFSRASDELSHLQWVPLEAARGFDLPFITQVVLAEVRSLIARGTFVPESVPFFRNDDEESLLLRLGGAPP